MHVCMYIHICVYVCMCLYVPPAHTSQSSICSHTRNWLRKKFLKPGWQTLFMSCTTCRGMAKHSSPSKTLALIHKGPEEQSLMRATPCATYEGVGHHGPEPCQGCTHFKACPVAAQSSNPLTYWYRQNLRTLSLAAQAHPLCPQPHSYKSHQLE